MRLGSLEGLGGRKVTVGHDGLAPLVNHVEPDDVPSRPQRSGVNIHQFVELAIPGRRKDGEMDRLFVQ